MTMREKIGGRGEHYQEKNGDQDKTCNEQTGYDVRFSHG